MANAELNGNSSALVSRLRSYWLRIAVPTRKKPLVRQRLVGAFTGVNILFWTLFCETHETG
jgi:hypothetical protein